MKKFKKKLKLILFFKNLSYYNNIKIEINNLEAD